GLFQRRVELPLQAVDVVRDHHAVEVVERGGAASEEGGPVLVLAPNERQVLDHRLTFQVTDGHVLDAARLAASRCAPSECGHEEFVLHGELIAEGVALRLLAHRFTLLYHIASDHTTVGPARRMHARAVTTPPSGP